MHSRAHGLLVRRLQFRKAGSKGAHLCAGEVGKDYALAVDGLGTLVLPAIFLATFLSSGELPVTLSVLWRINRGQQVQFIEGHELLAAVG